MTIKLTHYNIKIIFCQERNFIMDDPDLLALRHLIKEALEECTDTSLLDMVYKILISNSAYSGGV